MFACIHGTSAELPQIAEAFSPFFEQTTPDTVVFRIDGLKRLFGSPAQIADAIAHRAGSDINISIAETAEAAILAARNFPGVTVNPDLNTLDITTLPLTDEMAEILDSWGIHTLDQLAQLPETGIAERFGPAGVSLLRLARGAVDRPLKIFQPEITYDDRIPLDHPISLLEPLLFLIARMLNDQCEKLQSHGMAANEITIRLELENKTEHVRTLRLPIPMRESKALLKLLQMDLEAHPPEAATAALALSLKPVNPRTVQNGIFLPVTPAPDKLELTLARIRGIVGENNVGVPELLEHPSSAPFPPCPSAASIDRSAAHHDSPRLPLLPPASGSHCRTTKRSPRSHHRFRHPRKSAQRLRPMANFRRLVDPGSLESRRMGHHFIHRPLSHLPRYRLVHRRLI